MGETGREEEILLGGAVEAPPGLYRGGFLVHLRGLDLRDHRDGAVVS